MQGLVGQLPSEHSCRDWGVDTPENAVSRDSLRGPLHVHICADRGKYLANVGNATDSSHSTI